MKTNLKEIVNLYFDAWKANDFQLIRSLMLDTTTFIGPMGKCNNADDCMRGLQGLATITKNIIIKHIWVDNFDAITWYELYTTITNEPLNICNWMYFENNKISSIKVAFDPRSLLTS